MDTALSEDILAALDTLALAESHAALVTLGMRKRSVYVGLEYSHVEDDIACIITKSATSSIWRSADKRSDRGRHLQTRGRVNHEKPGHIISCTMGRIHCQCGGMGASVHAFGLSPPTASEQTRSCKRALCDKRSWTQFLPSAGSAAHTPYIYTGMGC